MLIKKHIDLIYYTFISAYIKDIRHPRQLLFVKTANYILFYFKYNKLYFILFLKFLCNFWNNSIYPCLNLSFWRLYIFFDETLNFYTALVSI